jgi:predicted acyl esterase
VPLARGWLRASHRKLDPARSTAFRPFHAHDEAQKLAPGRPYALDVELWPTSFVFPRGYRMVLTLTARDLEVEGVPGRILHTRSRALEELQGRSTVHTGGEHASYLVMPLIPG